MSELSKRLCDIAGIKPVYILNGGAITYIKPNHNVFIEKHPNFETNAENFVRLLETETNDNNTTVWSWLNWIAIKPFEMVLPNNRVEFLEQLINWLEESNTDETLEIKQALQNTDWSYND